MITAHYKNISICAEANDNGLSSISVILGKNQSAKKSDTNLQKRIAAAIEGSDISADLDLSWASEFQMEVYRAMMKIKPGQTMTYAQLAKTIKRPKAVRAVANACAANRLPIIIPCHRVIRSDGGLGGYNSKDGVKMKKYLLALEGCDLAG